MAKHDAEAYRFPEHAVPATELTDEFDRLWTEGRHKSALDAALRHLRAEGRSPEALHLARVLLSVKSRTPDPQVVEPVTPGQYGSRYFAPLATECARCDAYWYSGHAFATGRRGVLNPIGVQCQSCRYSLCRDCFDQPDQPRGQLCPEGCEGELGVPVLPTGRPRGLPANEFTEKLEHVLILWRDTPTSQEEADQVLDLACTWQDRGGITVRTQANPADEQDGKAVERRMGLLLVGAYEQHEMISEGGLVERTRVVPVEAPGRGRRLVFVTAAPATGPASQLSGPVTYLLSDDEDDADGRADAGGGSSARPPKRRWFRRRG